MAKQKRKLTSEEKAAKKRRKLEFMTIFVNGKQKRVRRPVLIDGMHPDDFLRINADPLWLHKEGEWHLLCDDQEATSIEFPEEAIAEIEHG